MAYWLTEDEEEEEESVNLISCVMTTRRFTTIVCVSSFVSFLSSSFYSNVTTRSCLFLSLCQQQEKKELKKRAIRAWIGRSLLSICIFLTQLSLDQNKHKRFTKSSIFCNFYSHIKKGEKRMHQCK